MAKLFKKTGPTVLLDVDTQYDMLPTLAAERKNTLLRWRRVMAWARKYRLPVVSLALAGREDDNVLQQSLCVENTKGHDKVRYTILADHFHYNAEHCLDLPNDIMDNYRQVIFERREFDPFQCDRFERLVNNFPFDHYIVFGGAFEASIKLACLGLLARHKKVSLVYDAVSSIYNAEYDYVLKKIEAKGARLEKVATLTDQKPNNRKSSIFSRDKNIYIPSV